MSYPTFSLEGKVAMLTGASRGIGRYIASGLAKYGADVVLTGRTVSELEQAAQEVESLGRRSLVIPMDMTRVDEIQSGVQQAGEAFERIDILINNAGINIPKPALEVTEEDWRRVIDTNLTGLFFCCQAVGRIMIKQKRGKIINISSQTGTVAIELRAAYCASKAGVNLVTKVLALEWGPYNINVNAVAPTFIETPMTKPMFENAAFKEMVLNKILLKRIGQPKDVFGAVIYLASEASDLVTGHVLLVDGGWTAH
ncbi:MAG: glucose 1-dehydrogenase [Proteobacteria bacterium]|jgi:NAD(P)-dependent dehydrogenase (short-subunit alcohol dehydrogenase family)|nr:glucose 1-dehydrogenase [Pseudomonadota bacterium]